MGSCISRAWLSFKQRKEKRCLLIGLDNAGKTTILYSLCNKDTKSIAPTTGFNLEMVQMKKFKFDIWDVGGQEQGRILWRHYYTGTDCVIYVIDGADRSRFDESKHELERMLLDDQLKSAIWLFVVNKQDVPGCAHAEEVEGIFGLPKLMEGRRYKIMDTVAKKNVCITDGMAWIESQLYHV
ncbi:hypothetical protein WA538_005528 [Blastocystis sp. DL]